MNSLVAMIILALLELVLTLFFVAGILTGRVDDVFLGAILGSEFLVLAVVMIFYMLTMLPPLEVMEDRDEGLLW
jgi:cadmium resistance protein CadD (predicted permease)